MYLGNHGTIDIIKQEESYKKTRRQVDIGMNVNKNKSECNIKVTCLSLKTFQKNYHFTNQNACGSEF